MKSFFSHLAGVKTAACLCYTASMLAYGAVCLAMGLETVEVMMVFQLGLVCLLCGAIQYILFSGAVVRAMPYGRRDSFWHRVILAQRLTIRRAVIKTCLILTKCQ